MVREKSIFLSLFYLEFLVNIILDLSVLARYFDTDKNGFF